jgi:CheY-like chemotaxis protein
MPDPLKILIVDDSYNMRSILIAVLRSLDIKNFEQAADGVEALEILKHYPADMCFCDFAMSPLDGIEFVQLVRNSADSGNPYLPVIMVTGHTELSRIKRARDVGVNEIVMKPVVPKVLLSRVRSVVHQPRPFIRARSYFGPDRRRKHIKNYEGPFRRESDGLI